MLTQHTKAYKKYMEALYVEHIMQQYTHLLRRSFYKQTNIICGGHITITYIWVWYAWKNVMKYYSLFASLEIISNNVIKERSTKELYS